MPSAGPPEIQKALRLLREEVHEVMASIEKLSKLIERSRPFFDDRKTKPS